jgi:hypothetical protein
VYLTQFDSATLQSTQCKINAHYNQRLLPLLDLTTKYEANTCVALPRTFSSVITTSMVQELNEKITGVDCMMR